MEPLEPPKQQPIGCLSDKYDLIKRIGYGASCKVYLARRRSDGELVAVKAPKANGPNQNILEMFKRGMSVELEAMRRLVHPNIIRLLDFGYDATVTED